MAIGQTQLSLFHKRYQKMLTNKFYQSVFKLITKATPFSSRLSYKFANSGKPKPSFNLIGKDAGNAEELKTKDLRINRLQSLESVVNIQEDHKSSTNWKQQEDNTCELTLQQKVYFAQAAGFLILLNIAVRLSLKNDNQVSPSQKKL